MFIKLEKFIINTDLIKSFNLTSLEGVVGKVWTIDSDDPITISYDDYKKLEKVLLSEEVSTTYMGEPLKSKPSVLSDLLNELNKLVGGRGEAKFTTDRKARLTTRLKDFSPEELKTAAKNLGEDEFMQGANDKGKRYGTIDYLLRTSANVNMWLEEQPQKKKSMF